jgi:hypothetical protein
MRYSPLRSALIATSLLASAAIIAPPDARAAVCTFPNNTRPIQRNWPSSPSSLVGEAITTGRHTCFERVVIRLSGSGAFPSYKVEYQNDPINLDESDITVYIRGRATLVINLQVWMPNVEGDGYSGPRRIFPANVRNIKELRETHNVEGHTAWAVGLDVKRSFRVFRLSNPPRLAVDIRR